jgi:hypothetical protein
VPDHKSLAGFDKTLGRQHDIYRPSTSQTHRLTTMNKIILRDEVAALEAHL